MCPNCYHNGAATSVWPNCYHKGEQLHQCGLTVITMVQPHQCGLTVITMVQPHQCGLTVITMVCSHISVASRDLPWWSHVLTTNRVCSVCHVAEAVASLNSTRSHWFCLLRDKYTLRSRYMKFTLLAPIWKMSKIYLEWISFSMPCNFCGYVLVTYSLVT